MTGKFSQWRVRTRLSVQDWLWQFDSYHWLLRKKNRFRMWRSWHLRLLGMRLWEKPPIEFWNDDKPHRCPECHAIVVSGHEPTLLETALALYECCRCGTRYARWPRLARRLRVCEDIAIGQCPNQGKD